MAWARIPLETYIFILNFSLPPRSEQVSEAHVNEIKRDHFTCSHSCFRLQIHVRLIIYGLVYLYLQFSFKYTRLQLAGKSDHDRNLYLRRDPELM